MSGDPNIFESTIFADQIEYFDVAGTVETVMVGYDMTGTQRQFEGLREALDDVDRVGVIGWSSQGPAQAQNLRDSFAEAGVDTEVVVGLRPGSKSRPKAEAAGFNERDGTLLTSEEAIGSSAMNLILIGDADLVQQGDVLLGHAKPGTTIGLSHGFYLGHLQSAGREFPKHLDLVGVCPKGMGPSVRALYEQGSGINTSFAVEQDVTGRAQDRALAWALGLGAPYTFQTTLESEWRSDIFGERAILLGGVHGIVEAMYSRAVERGAGGEEAYLDIVESLVRPISDTISRDGLVGLFEQLQGSDGEVFEMTYNAAYPALRQVTQEIYSEVSSTREIAGVIADGRNNVEMGQVDGTDMWRAGERVREGLGDSIAERVSINPEVAAVYVAGMMAQVDVLRVNGHHWSEIVNESIIEAVDSLNPYMRSKGVANMVDNCSVTARRGARKWAPEYQGALERAVFPQLDANELRDDTDHFTKFLNHDVHIALRTLGQMRPPVSIAL